MFTKKVSEFSYLLNNPLSERFFEEFKNTKLPQKYRNLIKEAEKKMNAGYSCRIDKNGEFLSITPEKAEHSFPIKTPAQLTNSLLATETFTSEQKLLVELFVSHESTFILLNFSLN